MTILVMSYNNEKFCEKNLKSILYQKYPNYRIIYIDDCSTDNTYQAVSELIAKHDPQHQVQLIKNAKNRGAMANFYHAIQKCQDHEIIVVVDGDDWLAHDHVLEKINRIYANPEVWLTYGQYMGTAYGSLGACRLMRFEGRVRDYKFVSSHLRTFYAGLFKQIKAADLKKDGRFFPMGYDVATMIPMMEMARDHVFFIPEVLYIYNEENILSDCHKDAHLQKETDRYIRSLSSYPYLDRLPWRGKL